MGFLQKTASSLTPQSTFHAEVPPIQQQSIIPQINNSQHLFAQDQDQQRALAQALLAQSQGKGPNIAQLQLQNATNQNVAQAAGMAASQKGINPALAQRQALQNAAMAQQQSAGQAGMQRAQQQLGSQGQLGGLYGQISGQQLQNQNILQNAQAAQNQAINQGHLGAAGINAGVSMGNMQAVQGTQAALLGGIAGGLGGAGSYATQSKWGGGEIHGYDEGGAVAVPQPTMDNQMVAVDPSKPKSLLGGALAGASGFGAGFSQGMGMSQQPGVGAGIQNFGPVQSGINQFVSGVKEKALSAGKAMSGGMASGGAIDFRSGGHVPGHAKVAGDSVKNDTIPAVVSPGEIVIPRSIAQGKNAPDKAASFVAAVLAKKGRMR